MIAPRRRVQGSGSVRQRARGALFAFGFLCLVATQASARDAAFLDPGTGAGGSEDAIKVEPKNDIDVGESQINVARRVDLFFVNQGGEGVKVEKVSVSGDSNVATEIVSDDCSKQGVIAPGSRCTVQVSATPSTSGTWTAEVLLTHDGAGRIARARLSGKTAGSVASDKKDTGLSLSTKEASPVTFGDVEPGSGKAVRSALMINDSNEPITLYSIDVIEASNGLQRLEQGCAVDMELKPGESCPVTLVWAPTQPGAISTDLIIRHSGRLGFAVVSIRGNAKGVAEGTTTAGQTQSGAKTETKETKSGGALPPPPSASEVERAMAGHVAPVSQAAIGGGTAAAAPVAQLCLIGTVGNRAVILKPDGTTAVASAGDELDLGDKTAKVVTVGAKSVDLLVDGKKKILQLAASPTLVQKASLPKGKEGKAPKDDKVDPGIGAVSLTPKASGAPSGGLP